MAARYQHLSPAFLADAVSHLDRAFGMTEALSSVRPAALVAASEKTAEAGFCNSTKKRILAVCVIQALPRQRPRKAYIRQVFWIVGVPDGI
jgi:hypothetical protein